MKKILERWVPHPVLSVLLLITWLLLNNTIAMGHVVLGSILAILVPWFTSSFWPEKICLGSLKVMIKFFFVVMYDIVVANIAVARLILGPNSSLNPGFLEVHLDIVHPLGISVLASTISLTPGTVSSDLSPDRKILIVHALHIIDEKTEIQEIKNRYEKPLMEIFKTC
jgi:multicomponent K+:H+ antiporter subunit E